MAGIQLQHIYKRYDDRVDVVKDFNLEIKDQEFVILVGPSGCGKSTTLRMIAGLEAVSEGKLFIDGKEMSKVPSCDRDIAMIFQNYALYPHMTVAENMSYSLKLQGVPKKERMREAQRIGRLLGLEEVLERKPKELSGGQKQRTAMGRAIIRNPKIFLMDEPLSNLDAKLRTQMRVEILKMYHELKATFVYVTHDQTEAMTLGTKIVVMKDGEIQQVASPKELYETPENLFVAGFIGIPPMNFFMGTFEEVGEQGYFVCEDMKVPLSNEQREILQRKNYSGKELIVGVRPEDIIISEEGNQSTIQFCEMIGAESYLHFEYGGTDVTVRVSTDRGFKKEDSIRFRLDAEKLHLFDKKSTKRICNV